MADRFDLEEQLVACWDILKDLKMIVEPMEDDHIDRKRIEAVIELYDMKFNYLWNIFSELVETKQFRSQFDE
jgi:hypothetical protein